MLGLGLEELADEGLVAWCTPVPEDVFDTRGALVFWSESVDEVKIGAEALESEGGNS